MFKAALLGSVARLDALKKSGGLREFAVIGAFAVAKWARPRATADIDYVISLSQSSAREVADALGGKYREGALGDPLLGVVEYVEDPSGGAVPIQLLLFPPAWEEVALYKIGDSVIDGVSIPIADWRALVLLKLYAGSALDLEDAESLVRGAKPTSKDIEYLHSRAGRLRVSRRLDRVLPRKI